MGENSNSRRPTMEDTDPQINISRIKVAGVGGFGLVVVVAAMALELPAVRAFVIAGLAGGTIGAAALALYRGWRGPGTIGPGPIFNLDERPIENRGHRERAIREYPSKMDPRLQSV
jgi:hypothetical protein